MGAPLHPADAGVSLVTADDWILRYFASSGIGDIARLNYAKRLFAVPIAILGQAVGQASLPFFSRLFGEKKFEEFAATVNGSVYRVAAASLLMTGWMMAIAVPLIDLVYRRGSLPSPIPNRLQFIFLVFAVPRHVVGAGALCEGILCLKQYHHSHGGEHSCRGGFSADLLAAVQNFIADRTRNRVGHWHHGECNRHCRPAAHSRHGVVRRLNWKELGKAALVGVVSGGLSYEVMRTISLDGSRRADLLAITLGSLTWAAAVAAGLWLLRSELPGDLRRKKATSLPSLAEGQNRRNKIDWNRAIKSRRDGACPVSAAAICIAGETRQAPSLRGSIAVNKKGVRNKDTLLLLNLTYQRSLLRPSCNRRFWRRA